ncbi:hypothetical protein R1flu_016318 [Riccia fluitans]|uniref:Uncharacterized protein n=1 Tax=Riccia fluitans TaxID=41844 RepID=A0ABD1YPL4_9MARC
MCEKEFICCALVREFTDNVRGLEKVLVKVLHTGRTVETFRSCSEFTEKFQNCFNHTLEAVTIAGVFMQDLQIAADAELTGTILIQAFESEAESEWSEIYFRPNITQEGTNSEADSDWEDTAREIVLEDLPRLGLLKVDNNFKNDPFDWQMADLFGFLCSIETT